MKPVLFIQFLGAAAAFLAASSALAQSTMQAPVDKIARQVEALPATGKAATASAAASAAQAGAGWLNQYLNSKVVSSSIADNNKFIKDTLVSTGQTGVLYEVAIQRFEAEAPVYTVVSGGIQYLGAGTSPTAVSFANTKRDTLQASTSSGAVLDEDKSHFIWFTLDRQDSGHYHPRPLHQE